MQIKLYTGKSEVIIILMILILSPYLFLKNVIFRHGFVHEFFANFVHDFGTILEFVRIRMNFLHEKLVMLRMACTGTIGDGIFLKGPTWPKILHIKL